MSVLSWGKRLPADTPRRVGPIPFSALPKQYRRAADGGFKIVGRGLTIDWPTLAAEVCEANGRRSVIVIVEAR